MTKKNQDATFEAKSNSNSNSESNTNTSSQNVQISAELLQQLAFSQQAQSQDNEIDLAELFKMIWDAKFKIIFITVVFAIASVFYALSLPNIYKSEVLLAPVADESSGMNSLTSKFGGLASLAGVNLGGEGANDTMLALEILQSRKFITNFIQDNDLLVILMASEGWNQNDGELIISEDLYDLTSQKWVRNINPPFKQVPSDQEAFKAFKGILSVSQDKDTSLVTISIEHYSPEIAKIWVEKLVKAINSEMRNRDLAEAEKSIRFITMQLEQTDLAELKNVLYQILQEQTKTKMFAQVREEYVFTTIDPALAPQLKDNPRRALIVVFITLIGAMFSFILVLIGYFKNK